MNYFYYQQEGGDEKWKPIKADKLITLEDAMFSTILSVDVPVSDTPSREQLNEIKYKGPLYFDLDDATSPASTAIFALQLCKKLETEGVFPQQLEIYATGGKGFHIIVPEEIFLAKPPKVGINHLPYIYKEMAYELAVESMDFRVYTGKKGRMFRRPNVKRPNGLYKVLISYAELAALAETSARDTAQAEEDYKALCSTPRRALEVETDAPELAGGLMAMFDQCKAKVTKSAKSRAKAKPITLPKELPSFEAMLRGEGIKSGIGFQNLATQIAVTAHAKGMSRTDLLAAAEGLCNSHQSDGSRYNTPAKRRAELGRMWDYMEDNPCYGYMPKVITSMLTHTAPDLYGLSVTGEEVAQDIAESDAAIENGDEPAAAEFEHANLFMTRQGAFTLTDAGPKQVTAISFDNVTELISPETNQVSVVEADVLVAGKLAGRQTFELDTFNSVSNLNRVAMRYGQSFSGNDIQARGMYMRLVERARKNDNRMYVTNREGLDFISIPFHEDERMRNGFMVWSDGENVVTEPGIADTGLKLKFVGYPDPLGQFQTDLSAAPPLMQWIKEDNNKELMRSFLENMLKCQHPTFIGKMLGWYTACHYRMLFHGVYKQFPLLHINGFAGQGKTQMTLLFTNLHYYKAEAKLLSPSSTLFAVGYSAASSASVPLVLDEFKPAEMPPAIYDKFKLMLRDAYNCRSVERGGGTRDNADYRAVHRTQLAAPICFIAEAAENESALMERVVLLTLVKPPSVRGAEYRERFELARGNKEFLGIIGKYISAQIVKRYSVDKLREEFDEIYSAERRALMLQPGEVISSPEEYQRKSTAKDRTVFNYAVVKFGLTKFQRIVQGLFGSEFDNLFEQMFDTVCDSMEEIQAQTVPEWLKVLNTFADMTKINDLSPFFLQKGKDYAYVQYAGKNCLELYTNSAYFKYRAYCAAANLKPLFGSSAAFVHAMNHVPALVEKGTCIELNVAGGSHILDLDELRANGFLTPDAD